MKAALVTSFGAPPRYADVGEPTASGPADVVVNVLAAGLHPRVRSQADGSHYTSTGVLPLVPGIDGVGRGPDGRLRYFVLPDTTAGSMAERTVVDERRGILLPEDTDEIAVAAAMNPAMSSWVALRRRIMFRSGQSVLILGATGSAGRLAVQVARHLGAGRVVGVGRSPERLAGLERLGADATMTLPLGAHEPDQAVALAADLARDAADVDVVLDYLWGDSAVATMLGLVTGRRSPERTLTWVQLGSVSGRSASIPSAVLRAARLEMVGSGQGSVGTAEILAELPELAHEISAGHFAVDARPVPLADVERIWPHDAYPDERLVLVP